MAGTGGYQQPTNPAPVSGPGNLARRTDGGPGAKQPMMTLPDAKYGEAKAFKQQEQGAPMAALGGMPTPTGPPAGPGPGGPPGGAQGPGGPAMPDMPTPLSDPTQRPDEPVTHGADAGPGPGSDSLGLMSPAAQQHQDGMSALQSMVQAAPDNPTLQWLSVALSRGL